MKDEKRHCAFCLRKLENLTPEEKNKLEEIRLITLNLMKEYNVSYYNFKYGFSKKWAGCVSVDTIFLELIFVLTSDQETIRNTILHEIAHAIVGCREGHRIKWQNKAKELGVKWRYYWLFR